MRDLYFVLVSMPLLLIPIFTSQIAVTQYGATVELDQKVYTWTDKIYITIVAPDHNFDSNLIDTIGDTADDSVKITTRGNKIDHYKLVENGTDTGIFTGEIILTGFLHDADGDRTTGDHDGFDTNPRTEPLNGGGPTNGFLETENNDGITVSFESAKDETVVGSALVRWNEGEIQFLETNYPTTGQGIVSVTDPDMNLNPEFVDSFKVNVWSDSDSGGIDLTVTETGEATGIFDGTVSFSSDKQSSGDRLRVAEGDTVTAVYNDYTPPDYPSQKQLALPATTFIGTMTPPLERIMIDNPRIVDLSGKIMSELKVNQNVLIAADLKNNQGKDQPFAYFIQIKDQDGLTGSLPWITGTLLAGQSMSPAQSWTPTSPGTYSVQILVWQSVDNPTALAPSITLTAVVKGEEPEIKKTGTEPPTIEKLAFDFVIDANDVKLNAGDSNTSTVIVTKKSGNAKTVSLSCTLKIKGTCDVIPSDVIPDGSATITIHTDKSTPADTYVGTITGKAGNIQRYDKFTVHVSVPPFPLAVIVAIVVGGVGAAGYAVFRIVNKPDPDLIDKHVPDPIDKPPIISSARIVIGGGMNE